MRLVILESPFAAPTEEEIDANVRFARACVRDSLARGESPIASHLLYTQPDVLDDRRPEERALGMKAGLAWIAVSGGTVVYIDRGISRGMRAGVAAALKHGKPVDVRLLQPHPDGAAMLEEAARTLGLLHG